MIGLAAWVGVSAVQAQEDLESARGHAELAKTALLAGDSDTALAEAAQASVSAGNARSATESLPWDVVGAIPLLGRPAAAVQELTIVVDDLAREVLLPLADVGGALSPDVLRPAGGEIDLAALATAQPVLRDAADAAGRLAARMDTIPSAGYVTSIDDARLTLQEQLDELVGLLDTAATAATLAPSMLGADGPRHYFMAFQTNAEARGTGGLVGGYGILTADNGTLSLDTLDSNTDLTATGATPLDLGPDFADRYGAYQSTSDWGNSNMSPHFPYAAQIWVSLWEQRTGQRLDGAIGTDPVALSYLLAAVGPITLADGQIVDAGNVVQLTEADAYARFAEDTTARKAYLQSIAAAVVARAVGGEGGSTTAVLSALGQAAGEGRLAVWSSVPAEQAVFAGIPLGQVVPEGGAPYAHLVVNNAGGNKLEYYLGRSLHYAAGDCSAQTRTSTVTATLVNGAPASGLSSYVGGRRDTAPTGPPGTTRLLVSLYATAGAELTGVTVDGVPTTALVDAELGHPVFTIDVEIPPGESQVIRFELIEPISAGTARVPVQPLVLPVDVSIDVPVCRD